MESGLILLNKKKCVTSFDALRDIKRSLGTGKVGHTGTLDKFAQGLLLVLVGRALKLSQWFTHCDKQYEGKIHFGIETDTLDPEGKVTAEAEVPSRENVEKALSQFNGEIMQTPPAYSAIHINGKRASELARSGQAPEMKKRQVNIYKIELRDYDPPFADIFVHCSCGVYIRSIARDIALAAGSRGHLASLVRTQIAGFKLPMNNEYIEIRNETLHTPNLPVTDPYSPLPIDKTIINLLGLPWFELESSDIEKFIHGKAPDLILSGKHLFPSMHSAPRNAGPMSLRINSSSKIIKTAAVFCGETLAAVVEEAGGKWKYGCVMGNG